MNQFRTDNTDGFSAAELDTMNDEFHAALAEAVGDLPDGVEGADPDTIAQIKQSIAEEVLKAHGGA